MVCNITRSHFIPNIKTWRFYNIGSTEKTEILNNIYIDNYTYTTLIHKPIPWLVYQELYCGKRILIQLLYLKYYYFKFTFWSELHNPFHAFIIFLK